MLEEKKSLEDQLEEAVRRRAEAERGRAEGRSEENKICLVGVSFCLNVPSFGGVSTGIFLLGVVLGLVCGCRCDTSRLCSIFNCCCPASARAGSDVCIFVFFCIFFVFIFLHLQLLLSCKFSCRLRWAGSRRHQHQYQRGRRR